MIYRQHEEIRMRKLLEHLTGERPRVNGDALVDLWVKNSARLCALKDGYRRAQVATVGENS